MLIWFCLLANAMNTKNLPQLIQSMSLAFTPQVLTGIKLTELLILVFLSIVSLQQPIRADRFHPTIQPKLYELQSNYDSSTQTTELSLAQSIVPKVQENKSTAPIQTASSNSTSDGLSRIKQCESGGNYRAINAAGYYGAYQFSPSTWNSTANAAGRPDLVGVRPDNASPADQDAMANKLHSLRGWQPWGCARRVGLK